MTAAESVDEDELVSAAALDDEDELRFDDIIELDMVVTGCDVVGRGGCAGGGGETWDLGTCW